MKRYHEEILLARRREAEYRRHIISGPAKGLGQPGYFRKRKPLDCGRPRCQVCHFTKIYEIPTIQDLRAKLLLRESLQEMG